MSDTTPQRSKAEIERDIAAARDRLAQSVEDLLTEVHPKAVVHRSVEEAKTFAQDQYENAKGQVKDEYGWRIDRLAILAGAVVGVVTLLLVVRGVSKKKGA